MIDQTHNPAAECWVSGAAGHVDFPVQNLPLGVFSTGSDDNRIGVAIGDWILDLKALELQFAEDVRDALGTKTLNTLFALPSATRRDLRHRLFALLTDHSSKSLAEPHLHLQSDVEMQLPFQIGDYTDFYVGIHHATNIGKLFRPDNPLLPNYKHVPIGYHGRSSSVQVSGAPVIRPKGQRKLPDRWIARSPPPPIKFLEIETVPRGHPPFISRWDPCFLRTYDFAREAISIPGRDGKGAAFDENETVFEATNTFGSLGSFGRRTR